jgi:hypothetical protein
VTYAVSVYIYIYVCMYAREARMVSLLGGLYLVCVQPGHDGDR